MQIIDKDKCTGCGACYNACPKNAIRMIENERGFLKPVIDETKCINCKLCEKICPVKNYQSKNINQPKAYAFINKNDEIRLKSSSGAVFPSIANIILSKGGIVFGTHYDNEMKVCHTKIDKVIDIEKLQSSKYVQSDTKKTYQEVKYALENGQLVLYTGTPCQIAGLYSYLKKDYEKLLTIDLVCHGVPSRKIFEMYKKEFMLSKKDNGKLVNINFRSKNNGWTCSEFSTTTTTTTTTTYQTLGRHDDFMKCFLSNLILNNSCNDCHFNKIPRVADLTMGDFWGVDEFDTSLNDNKGTSILLINTEKGKKFFEIVKTDSNVYTKEVPLNVALKGNPNIIGSTQKNHACAMFWNEINTSNKTLHILTPKYVKKYAPILKILYKLCPQVVKKIIDKHILHRSYT